MKSRNAFLQFILIVALLVAAAVAHGEVDLGLSSATGSGGHILMCPDGDTVGGVVSIQVTLLDINGDPEVGYLAENIQAKAVAPGFLTFCDDSLLTADADTDENGQTTITKTLGAGGGYSEGLHVHILEGQITSTPLDFQINSFDTDGDLDFGICDIINIWVDIFSATYNFRSDFYYDGEVNLIDFSEMRPHFDGCHSCSTEPLGPSETAGEVGIFFDTAGTQTYIQEILPGDLITAYVVALSAPDGIAGYAFKVEYDPGIILLNDPTLYPAGALVISRGDNVIATTGPDCLPDTGPVVLARYQVYMLDEGSDITMCLTQADDICWPAADKPAYMVCGEVCEWRYFGSYYPPDECARINPIIVTTEGTTWGTLKALFRD